MKFETLRLMAQDYADRHKEPPSLPAIIDTMAYAYQRICQREDPWTALGDFSNAWYGYARHSRPDLVKEPLIRPEQETEYTQHWGAFCAASVEYLCSLHHQPCPEWVHDPSYILDTPWWYTQRANDPTIRENLRRMTPPPFARRNIFCSNRLYQNKYEMYEWIQEAVVKGITDVHEIQRYARQKEISLYGAFIASMSNGCKPGISGETSGSKLRSMSGSKAFSSLFLLAPPAMMHPQSSGRVKNAHDEKDQPSRTRTPGA